MGRVNWGYWKECFVKWGVNNFYFVFFGNVFDFKIY